MLRHQLPAYSPVSWAGVMAGAMAVVRGDPGGRMEGRLTALLKARYEAMDVLLTDSGTSALRLAIAGAVRDEGGGLVALPGYCCYDVATAAEGARTRVALYDLDPATLGPEPRSLESVVRLGVGAVVIVHLWGLPVDVTAVRSRIGGAVLIEDAAQGAGGTLDGRPLGSFGSVSVLSFGRGKGMTGGGGGALLAHDDRGRTIVEWARGRIVSRKGGRGARQVALLAAQHVLGRPAVYGIPAAVPYFGLGETVYRSPWEPRPMAMSSLAALERLVPTSDREAAARRANAQRWRGSVERSDLVAPFKVVAGGEPGYLRFPVRVTTMAGLARLRTLRRHGVMPGYPTTLAPLPGLAANLRDSDVTLTGSDLVVDSLVTLPTHSRLQDTDVDAVGEFLGGDSGKLGGARTHQSTAPGSGGSETPSAQHG